MALSETRMLPQPKVSRDAIVFSYAGDLYNRARIGGVARNLTGDLAMYFFPIFPRMETPWWLLTNMMAIPKYLPCHKKEVYPIGTPILQVRAD